VPRQLRFLDELGKQLRKLEHALRGCTTQHNTTRVATKGTVVGEVSRSNTPPPPRGKEGEGRGGTSSVGPRRVVCMWRTWAKWVCMTNSRNTRLRVQPFCLASLPKNCASVRTPVWR
jgi:hypothetical protein